MFTRNRLFLIILTVLMVFTMTGTVFADIIYQPTQPTSGPGGSEYVYNDVQCDLRGIGDFTYVIYEPYPKASTPLPVVTFVHGYMGATPSPDGYLEFIHHLVKKGNIVIFPYYQSALTLPEFFDTNAAWSIRDAIKHIKTYPLLHAQPKYDSSGKMYFGITGHSAGGMTTANLAAMWEDYNIPKPKAICVMEPGVDLLFPWRDLSKIPADIYMQVIVGEEDYVVYDTTARHLWEQTSQIPNSQKDWILLKSDYHGCVGLDADHFAPAAGYLLYPSDALDYYGFWKWCVALMNFANFGTDGEYALGNTPEQRFMGVWSDSQPVIEAVVTDTPVWP